MTAGSNDLDLETQRQVEKLKHGSTMQIAEALNYYRGTFVLALKSNVALLGLAGYWCEGYIRSLKNQHMSPAYREIILQILANDFPIQMFETEVRAYYLHASPVDRLAMLNMLDDENTPVKLRSIIESLRSIE